VRWTVFKSRFCGFATQKYSTKAQLKNCRLARRYVGKNVKFKCFGKYEKAKANVLRLLSFWVCVFGNHARCSEMAKA
jgi:hypothetical protein